MTVTSTAVLPDKPQPGTSDPALPRRSWPQRIWRPADQPPWARPALIALLVATAVLYLWGLSASGWANSFYSAAVQAGSTSWKAFFFGSSDAGNSITVDKTPASLWLMALSVRAFGLSSWSILIPEALAGVAAVGLLYASVRRWFGSAAGLLAGAVMALTPVAVLMFRYNNPDALLMLLLVAGAYATIRALETASTRWLALVGVLVGFGFLTKMLQALLVVPAFALAYLVAAPTGLGRRIRQLLISGAAMVVSAGWWIAIVELLPASARPYIGGSQSNSILELTLGYNGLGRLTGNEVGSVGGGGAARGGPASGQTGLLRLFDAENGGQVAWLLPAALALLVVVLALTWRATRTDRTRAAFVLWGGWLVVTGVTFSLMAGIFHAYYNVALAPAIGAVVGMGSVLMWRRRDLLGTAILAVTVAGTAIWSSVLLGRSATFQPWLRPAVLIFGFAAAVSLVLVRLLTGRLSTVPSLRRAATTVALAAGIFAALAGPAAYAVDTAATPHAGAIPTAGPNVARADFGGGRGGPGGPPPGFGGPGAGAFPGGGAAGGVPPAGQGRGGAGAVQGGGMRPNRGGAGGGGAGGMGGLLDAAKPSAQLVQVLQADASKYTWVAAAIGSNSAAGYQLETGEAVMPIGGFNGSDPSPTLAQFQQYVRDGKVHYFIGGGGGGGGGGFRSNGGSSISSEISAWVQAHFAATTVGGATLYDLTRQSS
jgi:4-amino-4-deoxy-L-arabinose transferase-like glycosyltransferase